jgi:hypothetical protein
MRVAPIALAIFGAMLGSSEAVAVTYSSSPFSNDCESDPPPQGKGTQLPHAGAGAQETTRGQLTLHRHVREPNNTTRSMRGP